jgi:putative ABC transport system substrate-binding protein
VEGENLVLEFRWAEGKYERLEALAAELVDSKPDVIVTHATPGTRAAMRATRTIPIVMATNGDAVAQGLVATLAQPGGNVTGTTFLQPELMAKRIELLQAVRPGMRRLGVLLNPANPTRHSLLREIQSSAESLGVSLEPIDVERRQDLSRALADAARRRLGGVIVRDDAMYIAAAEEIAMIALAQKLPTSGFKDLAERGGLIGYGVNFAAMFRRVGYFVDTLVKGTPASIIPVEQARSFELVVNVKTARALRLPLPTRLLVRADRLIE